MFKEMSYPLSPDGVVITDNKIPEEYLSRLEKLGVNLIIAE